VYARLTLHTADPVRLGEVISHHEQDVMGVLTHEPGNRGMSVLVNDDLGVAMVEAYWATEKEMRSNDTTFVRPVHDAAFFGATVSIEHYERSWCAGSSSTGWIFTPWSWNNRGTSSLHWHTHQFPG
jgi:hypothetical protein